ncbi:CD225/dispanin family protein [Gordonia caeni]|uniref:CD225/dispanin family protein n=1 Tax=Gordonia caeni TaxID=1007097 RepID=A0ABP7NXD0_9ACTN
MTTPNDDNPGNPEDPNQTPGGFGEQQPPPFGEQPQYGGQQPPQFGEQPPYGEQPQYGQTPQYGQQPQYGQPQYGQPQYGATPGTPAGAPPANNMVSAIIVTVLGFLFTCVSCISLVAGILGVVAIVKANAVNQLWNAGDAPSAQRNADEAKKWANIAWIVFGVSVVLWIIFLIVIAATGTGVGYYDFSTT